MEEREQGRKAVMMNVGGYVIVLDRHGKIMLLGKSKVPELASQNFEANGMEPFENRMEIRFALAEIITGDRKAVLWKKPGNVEVAYLTLKIAQDNGERFLMSQWRNRRFVVIHANGEGDQLIGQSRRRKRSPIVAWAPLSERGLPFPNFRMALETAGRMEKSGRKRISIAAISFRRVTM